MIYLDYSATTPVNEEVCNEVDGEELEQLDYISSTIAERDYYQNTNK